ncbi:hypothetical protein PSEUDO9AG_40096 [Pseudomonas sp. 9Ag]|nr:hypothetical protein PSEUDO9AG_40096 [Pseudomonas sp. 9Ag]
MPPLRQPDEYSLHGLLVRNRDWHSGHCGCCRHPMRNRHNRALAFFLQVPLPASTYLKRTNRLATQLRLRVQNFGYAYRRKRDEEQKLNFWLVTCEQSSSEEYLGHHSQILRLVASPNLNPLTPIGQELSLLHKTCLAWLSPNVGTPINYPRNVTCPLAQ